MISCRGNNAVLALTVQVGRGEREGGRERESQSTGWPWRRSETPIKPRLGSQWQPKKEVLAVVATPDGDLKKYWRRRKASQVGKVKQDGLKPDALINEWLVGMRLR